MDSKICFEMNFIVVEAIRGRCASFTVLTATVSEIFGGQTTPSILVDYNNSRTRNSVTMSCNSVTEQNLLIANNQCMHYDQTFVHCIATSDTNQMLLVIGNNW